MYEDSHVLFLRYFIELMYLSNMCLQDVHTSAWFSFLATTRWLGLWLDWTVVAYILAIVCSFLFIDDGEMNETLCDYLAISLTKVSNVIRKSWSI